MFFSFRICSGITNFECPTNDIANGCTGPCQCLYPDPATCKGYIVCAADGTSYTKSCVQNLHWDDKRKECDLPEQSTCPKKTK